MKIIAALVLAICGTLLLFIGAIFGRYYQEQSADERAEVRIHKKVFTAAMVNRPVIIGNARFTCQVFQEKIAGISDDGYRQDFSK